MGQIVSIFMAVIMFILSLFGIVIPDNGGSEPEENGAKNVIIMIGDGMGYNHIYAAENKYGKSFTMLDETVYHGFSETRSASSLVTDSAAGGSALSTGVKTINGYIAVHPTDPLEVFSTPASITEIAIQHGKSTGVVTSDLITGATPSAFSAHEESRDKAKDIFKDQLASEIDLIWGGIDTGVVSESACVSNNKKYVDSLKDIESLEPGEKSIGQFDSDTLWQGKDNGDQPTLSEATVEAIEILNADEDGFFLMVEGAHIDKRSHDKDGDGAMLAVLEFDNAVKEALEFAEKDGNTLVIITADHETGKVKPNGDGTYSWTSGDHSSTDVPVLVYGSNDFMTDGETMDNTEIPKRAVEFMVGEEQEFPINIK